MDTRVEHWTSRSPTTPSSVSRLYAPLAKASSNSTAKRPRLSSTLIRKRRHLSGFSTYNSKRHHKYREEGD